jgi:hypothetical protein
VTSVGKLLEEVEDLLVLDRNVIIAAVRKNKVIAIASKEVVTVGEHNANVLMPLGFIKSICGAFGNCPIE